MRPKNKIVVWLLVCTASALPIAANAALTSVTQVGGLMVSDSALNVTWADVASPTNLTWSAIGSAGSAQAWVASLNSSNYGGYNNWTLATGDGSITSGPTYPTQNELGYLFFTELGNAGAGNQITNTSPFESLDTSAYYWSDTLSENPGTVWSFDAFNGIQVSSDPSNQFNALAVRPGQVVPLPSPACLLLSALGGLGLIRHTKCAALRKQSGTRGRLSKRLDQEGTA